MKKNVKKNTNGKQIQKNAQLHKKKRLFLLIKLTKTPNWYYSALAGARETTLTKQGAPELLGKQTSA